MNDSAHFAPAPVKPPPEAVYSHFYPRLVAMAWKRFGVPETVAVDLAQDVFLRWMVGRSRIVDDEAWLAVAMFNDCRHYIARCSRERELRRDLPSDGLAASSNPETDLNSQLSAGAVVGALDPRTQAVLRMHYLEGMTAAEIAASLGTTLRYAEKLIHKGLDRARAILARERERR